MGKYGRLTTCSLPWFAWKSYQKSVIKWRDDNRRRALSQILEARKVDILVSTNAKRRITKCLQGEVSKKQGNWRTELPGPEKLRVPDISSA